MQRQLYVSWQDFVTVDDVVVILLDPQMTRVDLSANIPMQIAQGSLMNNVDGSRQATLLFPRETKATMTLPDGSTAPLATLGVRATEYTVGQGGP